MRRSLRFIGRRPSSVFRHPSSVGLLAGLGSYRANFAGFAQQDQQVVNWQRSDGSRQTADYAMRRVTSWPRPSVIDGHTVETPPLLAPATISQMDPGPSWMR